MSRQTLATVALLTASLLTAGCAVLPNVGPSTKQIEESAQQPANLAIQIVDVDDAVARRLLGQGRRQLFSETLGVAPADEFKLGPGDGVEIEVWEAAPATLFGSAMGESRGAVSPASPTRPTTVSEQTIARDGSINMPFAGRIIARGRTLTDIENDIRQRLTGKANLPQVIARLSHNRSSAVTVVGEVNNSLKMSLTASGERLLDAIAAAGGVRQPVSKMTVQVTRGSNFFALPMDTIVRDPAQNVPLRAGDVVTAMFQPLSFTALGATGKNEEINFEAQGITLAQAIARSGGLLDSRSDARGLFIFRFEKKDAIDWPRKLVFTTPDDLVPVIYRLDLRNPSSFFVMQSFAIANKDILYVSNAPAAELQKFLNLVFSVAYPLLTTVQVSK